MSKYTIEGEKAQSDIRRIGHKFGISQLIEMAPEVVKVVVTNAGYEDETNTIYLKDGRVWTMDANRNFSIEA